MPGERLYLDTEPDPVVAERHIGRYTKAIQLAAMQGGNWVDFACGSGYGTAMIADVADKVIGIDASPDAINYARAHYPDVTFWWGGLAALEEALNLPVDAVVCVETLEHMRPVDQRQFMRVVADSGARLVLACPIGDGPSLTNPWHVHEPTEEELHELLCVFSWYTLETEEYLSTSGPAVQAWVVAE